MNNDRNGNVENTLVDRISVVLDTDGEYRGTDDGR